MICQPAYVEFVSPAMCCMTAIVVFLVLIRAKIYYALWLDILVTDVRHVVFLSMYNSFREYRELIRKKQKEYSNFLKVP